MTVSDGFDDTPTVRPVDLRDYADFSTDGARRVRVYATDALAVDLWCVEPQQSTGVLREDRADIAYTVIGGRSWFVTEQGEIGLDPLGAMLVPAGVTHGIDNRGADPLVVMASSSPPGAGGEDTPTASDAAAIRDDRPAGASIRRALRGLLDRPR